MKEVTNKWFLNPQAYFIVLKNMDDSFIFFWHNPLLLF